MKSIFYLNAGRLFHCYNTKLEKILKTLSYTQYIVSTRSLVGFLRTLSRHEKESRIASRPSYFAHFFPFHETLIRTHDDRQFHFLHPFHKHGVRNYIQKKKTYKNFRTLVTDHFYRCTYYME